MQQQNTSHNNELSSETGENWINLAALRHALNQFHRRDLTPSEKLILTQLARLIETRPWKPHCGAAWPSTETLAAMTGLNVRAVQGMLRSLKRKGVLDIQSRNPNVKCGVSNVYRLVGYEPDPAQFTRSQADEPRAIYAETPRNLRGDPAQFTRRPKDPISNKGGREKGEPPSATEGGEGLRPETTSRRERLPKPLTDAQIAVKDALLAAGLTDPITANHLAHDHPAEFILAHIAAAQADLDAGRITAGALVHRIRNGQEPKQPKEPKGNKPTSVVDYSLSIAPAVEPEITEPASQIAKVTEHQAEPSTAAIAEPVAVIAPTTPEDKQAAFDLALLRLGHEVQPLHPLAPLSANNPLIATAPRGGFAGTLAAKLGGAVYRNGAGYHEITLKPGSTEQDVRYVEEQQRLLRRELQQAGLLDHPVRVALADGTPVETGGADHAEDMHQDAAEPEPVAAGWRTIYQQPSAVRGFLRNDSGRGAALDAGRGRTR